MEISLINLMVGVFGAIFVIIGFMMLFTAYKRFIGAIEKIESFDGKVRLSPDDYEGIAREALERVKYSCRYTRVRLLMGSDDYGKLTTIGFQIAENHFMGEPITCSVEVRESDGFEGLLRAFEMLLYAIEDPNKEIHKPMTFDERSVSKGMKLSDYDIVTKKGKVE